MRKYILLLLAIVTSSISYSQVTITHNNSQSVTPDNGIEAGGETIVIFGSGFTATTSVLIGALTVSSFTVLDDNHISCVTPAQAAGDYDVEVVIGGSSSILADGYRYTGEYGSGYAVDWGAGEATSQSTIGTAKLVSILWSEPSPNW